jgi:hypothetical protein
MQRVAQNADLIGERLKARGWKAIEYMNEIYDFERS